MICHTLNSNEIPLDHCKTTMVGLRASGVSAVLRVEGGCQVSFVRAWSTDLHHVLPKMYFYDEYLPNFKPDDFCSQCGSFMAGGFAYDCFGIFKLLGLGACYSLPWACEALVCRRVESLSFGAGRDSELKLLRARVSASFSGPQKTIVLHEDQALLE